MFKNAIICLVCPAAMVVALMNPAGTPAQERVEPVDAAWETIRADFSNVRGLNYIASYAPSDVAMWRFYDHDQIDRELGYIKAHGRCWRRVL